MIDQSKVNAGHENAGHEMVMVSLRVGGRALPLAWQVRRTGGAIGFCDRRLALDAVEALLPLGARVTLMGDRFYGSPALIAWCRATGWGYRLRRRQDLTGLRGRRRDDARRMLRTRRPSPDRDRTHREPRADQHRHGARDRPSRAVDRRPVRSAHHMARPRLRPTTTPHDYALRWGIEAMVSDFKTRGFNLEDSQIERTDRLDRLILVLSLALYRAVSTGMWDRFENQTPTEKKPRPHAAATAPEA